MGLLGEIMLILVTMTMVPMTMVTMTMVSMGKGISLACSGITQFDSLKNESFEWVKKRDQLNGFSKRDQSNWFSKRDHLKVWFGRKVLFNSCRIFGIVVGVKIGLVGREGESG